MWQLNLLAIAAGGAIGAVARFIATLLFKHWFGVMFPYGTLVVNVVGSFLIGFLTTLFSVRLGATHPYALFCLTGLLGALTTFSSFSLETLNLFLKQQHFLAFLNIILNLALCLGCVYLGVILANKADLN